MAEPVKAAETPTQPPKEMSMELRLLLAFLLMGAVMFLTPYLYQDAGRPPAPKKDTAAATAPDRNRAACRPRRATPPAPAQPPPPKLPPAAAPIPGATPRNAAAALRRSIPTCYRVTFSNQGATVRSWVLKKLQGQRRQAARPGEHGRRAGLSLLAATSPGEADRPT